MNNKYFMVLISLNLAVASGCVFKEPYPNQWKEISSVSGECPEIHGTFPDSGELDPVEARGGIGEQYLQTRLSSIFFLGWEDPVSVSHIEIMQKQSEEIRFIAWNGDEVALDKTFETFDLLWAKWRRGDVAPDADSGRWCRMPRTRITYQGSFAYAVPTG